MCAICVLQTEDQYIFIHDALLEAVVTGYTEVPCRSLHHHIQQLMQTTDPVGGEPGGGPGGAPGSLGVLYIGGII